MPKEHAGGANPQQTSQQHTEHAVVERTSAAPVDETAGSKLATVAAIGIGVALIEAELIPGMLIGIAAMLAPNFLPKLGSGLRPLLKGAVRAGYAFVDRTKETVAEASEQLQDIVAEVKSEQRPEPAVAAPGGGNTAGRA